MVNFVPCTRCQGAVPMQAPFCPACGQPRAMPAMGAMPMPPWAPPAAPPTKPTHPLVVVLAIAVPALVGVGVLAWAMHGDGIGKGVQKQIAGVDHDGPSEPTGTVTEVSAKKLYEAYDANEVNADRTYKGQWLRVAGPIHAIKKGFDDHPYLELGDDAFQTVRADFNTDAEPKLAAMHTGDSVTVVCECTGRTFIDVKLRYCQVL